MPNTGSNYSDPLALATVSDLQLRFPEVVSGIEPSVLADILVEATSFIEDNTGRRLAPFTNHICEERLFGISPDEYGDVSADMPIDIYGSLGISKAAALGASDLVRHLWLDQYAPFYPELWTYDISSMRIFRTYGDYQDIDFNHGGILGPNVTDGHVWFRLGTFIPEGSFVKVVYSGGYTLGVPPALRRACLFQAIKYVILECEPQMRSSMDLKEIEASVEMNIINWVRG